LEEAKVSLRDSQLKNGSWMQKVEDGKAQMAKQAEVIDYLDKQMKELQN